jgi:hypothetical protein
MDERLSVLAFREYKIAGLYRTGNADVFLVPVEVPSWFVKYELGYGVGEEPSLGHTLRHLESINRRNLATFFAEELKLATRVARKARKKRGRKARKAKRAAG